MAIKINDLPIKNITVNGIVPKKFLVDGNLGKVIDTEAITNNLIESRLNIPQSISREISSDYSTYGGSLKLRGNGVVTTKYPFRGINFYLKADRPEENRIIFSIKNYKTNKEKFRLTLRFATQFGEYAFYNYQILYDDCSKSITNSSNDIIANGCGIEFDNIYENFGIALGTNAINLPKQKLDATTYLEINMSNGYSFYIDRIDFLKDFGVIKEA